ncbi:MAG: hypothetical protein ACYSWO_13865 [Planctomycetota bacterium]|jgi:hypothetical protein
MSDKQKRAGGPPTKYKPEFVKQAETLCRDEALDGIFDVGVSTLYGWTRKFPEFSQAIARGKDAFDTHVVESKLLRH